MRDLEDRVRESLHDLTDSLVVVTGEPPSPRRPIDGGDKRRRRVAVGAAAVLLAVSLAAVAAVVAARSGDGDVTITDVPTIPSITAPEVSAPAEPAETPANPEALGIGNLSQWMIADSAIYSVVRSVRTALPVEPVTAGDLSSAIGQLDALDNDAQLAVVVVHVGTDAPLNPEQFARLMTSLDRIPQVIVATVHGTDPSVPDNNALIRSAAERHSNVIVFDWADLIEACPGVCVTDDGRNLLDDGRWFYLEQLAALVGFDIPDRPTAATDRLIGAVTADGAAVVIDPATGTVTPVLDTPAEPSSSIGRVAVNGDGTTAFVDTCCVPVTGEVFAVDLTNPAATPESIAFSSIVAASPERSIALAGPGGAGINDFGGGMSMPIPTSLGSAVDLDWFISPKVDNPGSPFPDFDGSLAILVRGDHGISLHTVLDIARFTELASGITLTTDPDAEIRLAGTNTDGDVLIFDPNTPNRLTGYDPTTLQRTTELTLPGEALDAWNNNDNLIWIDAAGTLHTPTLTLPGPFRTARN
jgi:hypothetical protein